MRIVRDFSRREEERSYVAIGCFDGVHLAHREILSLVASGRKEGFLPSVITFDSIGEMKNTAQLMTDEQKLQLFEEAGIELTYHLDFEQIKGIAPDDFVTKILKDICNAKKVFVGYNFRFGRNGSADAEDLKKLCGKAGIEAVIVSELIIDGRAVSSTLIRDMISSGDIESANRLLGRPFSVTGEVVHGRKLGRTIGIPTMNLLMPENIICPKNGVYASSVLIDGERYRSVTNIGFNPTVEGSGLTVESWIMNFSGDLYGKTVTCELRSFIREERKFSSLEELKRRIAEDAELVNKYYSTI